LFFVKENGSAFLKFRQGLISQLGNLVLGLGKGLIPKPFRSNFVEQERRQGLLLVRGNWAACAKASSSLVFMMKSSL
jgi:hypothetical protein